MPPATRIPVRFHPIPASPAPYKPSPLGKLLDREDILAITQIGQTHSSSTSNPLEIRLHKGAQPKSNLTTPLHSKSSPSVTASTTTHRKRPSHKAPSSRRASGRVDVKSIIELAKGEDVEDWKGLGNERSGREWPGTGKHKSPQTSPHPTSTISTRRARTRTATPNSMPKPLTTGLNGKKGLKNGPSKSQVGAAAIAPHPQNTASQGGSATAFPVEPAEPPKEGLSSLPPSIPMTRKRSNGSGSALPLNLLNHENGSGKQIIPPSPLRESSVAVMSSLIEEEVAEEGGTGEGAVEGILISGRVTRDAKAGKKRKRPWEQLEVNAEGSEIAIPTKIRRGSEPFTSVKRAKEMVLSEDGDGAGRVPTGTSAKRAATLSPPPSPATLKNVRHNLMDADEGLHGLLETTDETVGGVAGTARNSTDDGEGDLITTDGHSTSETDNISAGSVDESTSTITPHPTPFLSTRLSSNGNGNNLSAPRLKRVASTDSYGSSSGAGRTRRETAIPKALRDYEMKIKV